jgi:hypothetical protein
VSASIALILAYLAYAASWLFHALHLSLVRSQLRIIATATLGIGFIAHSVFLLASWVEAGYVALALTGEDWSAKAIWSFLWHAPWETWPQRMAWGAWAGVFGYLSLERKFRIRSLGLVVTTTALLLLSAIGLREGATLRALWPYVRDGAELCAVVGALFAAASAMALLIRPSVPRDILTHRLILFCFALVTFHLLCAMLTQRYGDGVFWQWPKRESAEIVPWAIYGAAMYTRLQWGWAGRATAVFGLAGGIALAVALTWLHAYRGY